MVHPLPPTELARSPLPLRFPASLLDLIWYVYLVIDQHDIQQTPSSQRVSLFWPPRKLESSYKVKSRAVTREARKVAAIKVNCMMGDNSQD